MSYVEGILIPFGTFGMDINLQALDADGNAFDLTGYSTDWEILEKATGTQKFIVDCVDVDLPNGKVKYTLETGKFDVGDISYTSRLVATKTGIEQHFNGPEVIIPSALCYSNLADIKKELKITDSESDALVFQDIISADNWMQEVLDREDLTAPSAPYPQTLIDVVRIRACALFKNRENSVDAKDYYERADKLLQVYVDSQKGDDDIPFVVGQA